MTLSDGIDERRSRERRRRGENLMRRTRAAVRGYTGPNGALLTGLAQVGAQEVGTIRMSAGAGSSGAIAAHRSALPAAPPPDSTAAPGPLAFIRPIFASVPARRSAQYSAPGAGCPSGGRECLFSASV